MALNLAYLDGYKQLAEESIQRELDEILAVEQEIVEVTESKNQTTLFLVIGILAVLGGVFFFVKK